MRRWTITIAAAALLIAMPAHMSSAATSPEFEMMKDLVGTWRPADPSTSPLRVRFSLTAGGTTLIEEWLRGDLPHSLTVYHRDGARVMATHYCPQGNQPRLMSHPADRGRVLRFTFRDAADLDRAREAYLTALAFDLTDKALLIRSETYREGGRDEASELRLVRVPSLTPPPPLPSSSPDAGS